MSKFKYREEICIVRGESRHGFKINHDDMRNSVAAFKCNYSLKLYAPTQLFIHGQWWSMRLIHRLHILQWWELGGLYVWQWLHIACVVMPFLINASLGTASCGIDPGSVNVVFAWHARARAHIVAYNIATPFDSFWLCANNEIVNTLYIMRIQTIDPMTVPTWSPKFTQIPSSPLVPNVQSHGSSLYVSS